MYPPLSRRHLEAPALERLRDPRRTTESLFGFSLTGIS